MISDAQKNEMARIPSKEGRELFYEANRCSLVGKISDIAEDVGKFEREVTPALLLEHSPEYRELCILLQRANLLAEKSGNSTLARKELQDWESGGGLSKLCQVWGDLCALKLAIRDKKKRQWRRKVWDVVVPVASAVVLKIMGVL